MFGDGWTEILIIVVVAVVVIGPKDLPRVLRTVARWTGMMRRTANQFQGQFREALAEVEREAGLLEARQAYETMLHDNPAASTLAEAKGELSKIDAAGEALRQELAGLSRPQPLVEPAAPEAANPEAAPPETQSPEVQGPEAESPSGGGRIEAAPLDLAAAAETPEPVADPSQRSASR